MAGSPSIGHWREELTFIGCPELVVVDQGRLGPTLGLTYKCCPLVGPHPQPPWAGLVGNLLDSTQKCTPWSHKYLLPILAQVAPTFGTGKATCFETHPPDPSGPLRMQGRWSIRSTAFFLFMHCSFFFLPLPVKVQDRQRPQKDSPLGNGMSFHRGCWSSYLCG